MTREEIISNLLYMKRSVKEDTIEDITINEAIKALEQEQKTVLYSGDGYVDGYMVYDMAECPNCGYEYEDGDKDW